MRIVLIGFMGSGKSSVAKEISSLLNYELLEIDELIVENSSYKSIPEIFSEKGEKHFRDLESSALESVSQKDNSIVSCGGGVIGRESNIEFIKSNNSTVVFLDASFETIKKRIENLGGRPLFEDLSSAKELYDTRLKKYESISDLKINTDNKSIVDVSKEVIKKLGL